ncbi:hypothetical protein L873DRAFT_1803891 [Choiromyces venosus 120613-1]|uniref:Uncharacterized protein n=1 Tax=Choiromyces venosus 120613-1 TaxID=1336337 RepID=A0A3N4JSM5_9PEZI|nr:hypothetical protein L873DRAFT_1803891 [Choiromyces venosus 120613-1]
MPSEKLSPITEKNTIFAYQHTSPNIIAYMPYTSRQQYGNNRENSARFSFSFF